MKVVMISIFSLRNSDNTFALYDRHKLEPWGFELYVVILEVGHGMSIMNLYNWPKS